MKLQTIVINEQSFQLHPSGAVFWKAQNMLLIADVHLGKASHFRKHGSPVPMASVTENFNQLNNVVQFFKPTSLCFLGDLFHSHINNEWNYFQQWINKLNCNVILVSGNHDIIDASKFETIGIKVVDYLCIDHINLTHHPEDKKDFFTISGHIHPAITIKGLGRQKLTMPCFFKQKNQMILPAFGTFTGNFIIEPKLGDKVFVSADDEVIEVLLN